MEDDEIQRLAEAFNTADGASREAIWQQLRGTGDSFLPHFERIFPVAKRAEIRRDIAFHSIRFARTSECAFRIGLLAIADRSSIVRYRGCCILAYSLRPDAVLPLRQQLAHSDGKTAADARAAIDAIETRNHHYFVDRDHSDRSFWEVNKGDHP